MLKTKLKNIVFFKDFYLISFIVLKYFNYFLNIIYKELVRRSSINKTWRKINKLNKC